MEKARRTQTHGRVRRARSEVNENKGMLEVIPVQLSLVLPLPRLQPGLRHSARFLSAAESATQSYNILRQAKADRAEGKGKIMYTGIFPDAQ